MPMITELYISRRLFFDKSNQRFLSQRIIRIAMYGIALGMAAMIVSVAVVTGFKSEIRNKVVGFGSHIQIISFESSNSYETRPVSQNQEWFETVKHMKGVKHIQIYATKPGMIKTEEYNQGIVFKGIGPDFNWDFLRNNMVKGVLPHLGDSTRTNQILISEQISKLLKIKLNQKIILMFINDTENIPRMLQMEVCGIYRTSLEEFDNIFVFGDIRQIQRINNWKPDEASGFEIEVDNFNNIHLTEAKIRTEIINYTDKLENVLRSQNIVEQYPQIFDWLSVTDMNVWILLVLISLVSGFSMISGLLVLILERSNMIGVMKALGFNNSNIRKVFVYLSVFLTSRSVLWGNVAGVTFIFIQKTFHLIKLNPATYFMDYMPVNFSLLHLLILNIATITIISFMLVFPSYLVSKISPDRIMRFD